MPISEEDVLNTKWLISNTDLSNKEIAQTIGIKNHQSVNCIRVKKTHRNIILSEDYLPSKDIIENIDKVKRENKEKNLQSRLSRSKLKHNEILEIFDLLIHTKIDIKEIAKIYNVSTGCINDINYGDNWKELNNKDVGYPIRNAIDNPKSIRQNNVSIDGQGFENIVIASKELGIKYPTLLYRLKSKSRKFKDWYYIKDFAN